MIRITLTLLLMAALAGVAWAGNVDVRMVEARTEAGEATPTFPAELHDIQSLLAGNFAFNRYRLLGRARIALPADGRATALSGGYQLSARGGQDDLQVTITRGAETLLRTNVRLSSNKPVIIGGFNANGGRILFVLSL
jgi:hypothetical protein